MYAPSLCLYRDTLGTRSTVLDYRYSVSVSMNDSVRTDAERRLTMFENGCWGRYLGSRGTKWKDTGEKCIMRSFMICTAHSILLKYVFYSLKYNKSFILYLKLHKIRATSFGVLPSSGPSENNIRVVQSGRIRTEEKFIGDLVGKPEGAIWKTWV